LLTNETAQTFAHNRVIIYNENPNHALLLR
jgi:hypothetical protein